MPRPLLQLRHLTPLASGNNRDVFVHPHDPELLIKTMKGDMIERKQRGKSHNRFRRYHHYVTFLRECEEHIAAQFDPNGPPHFMQAIVGFVDTDRGLGFVTKAERDVSGSYAKTLQQLINQHSFDSDAQKALEQFIEAFLASRVIVTDLSIKNLVYSYTDSDQPHFVLIDGYGEKNFIPFNSLSAWCHQRSKTKRVKRLRLAIQRATLARDREQKPATHAD